VVAVNFSNQPVNLQLEAINGLLPAQVEQFETSEQNNLEPVSSEIAPARWTLPPLSVTTLVLDR
jgi:hypothetical protein